MDEYVANFKKKKKKCNKVSNVTWKNGLRKKISQCLLAVIFFLISIIYINLSPDNKALYKDKVLNESFAFSSFRNTYEKFFGNVLPEMDVKNVFDDTFVYKSIKDYLEGEALEVSKNTIIKTFASGVVVFNGEKEGYGNTIIIQGIDGYDIWYGGLIDTSVSLYDYIEKGRVIGNTKDNELYVVIKKDNEFIKFEDYKV